MKNKITVKRWSDSGFGSLAVAAGRVLLLALLPISGAAAGTQWLRGHVPKAVAHAAPVGRLPESQRLDLAIGLPLRNPEGLANLLQQIYDPASPRYRQYLTSAQFAEQFGPTEQDYHAVADFAQRNGFTVRATHPNRMLLDVNASVADIERAFHVSLRTYQHPSEARTFYAPDNEPSIDLATSILDITGLDDFRLPRFLVHQGRTPSRLRGARPMFGSGPGGTFRGNDFRAVYVPGVAVKGTGQAVGLLEFDGYYANDITSYESQTGLPNVPVSNVFVDNFNGNPGNANIEVALDIEMAIAMAPGLSKVIVYEAGPFGIPNDVLNRMATDNLVKQISSSWTWSGGINATTDQIFQQYAAQGQSFFQASGDSDAYVGSISQGDEPADNPYITIVGGTTLSTTGPGGAWVSEKTWNWYNSGIGTSGSSGGISTSYPIPSWQQGISMSGNQGSTTMRNIPDVALTADNIWVTYDNGSSGAVGGTSCAAPLWAAFAALVNQQAVANGQPTVGFINPALYAIAQGTNYSSTFHDITTGNNTNPASPSAFFAVSGYDLCTGWGSPRGGDLINALAGPAAPLIVSNSLVLTVEGCANGGVDPGETVTMNFGLANIGSANTANVVATLQVGGGVTLPSAAQTYGALTVGGPTVARPFSFTASGSCGGTLTATVQLQDGSSNLGTVNFRIPLGVAVSGTALAENFDGVTAPALPSGWATSVDLGSQVNWVSSNGASDTAPNSAFALDAANAGVNDLVSPLIPISSASAQLSFRHNYDLASHTIPHPRSTTYYDGGILEISIGGGAFTDILAAGGSYVAGGYNCTLSSGTGNALAGLQAWGGSSGGWITTTVNLPAAAAGQTIQLRWGCGTASSNPYTAVGWFVDSISIQDSSFVCCSPNADVAITQSLSTSPVIVGQNFSYVLAISNLGPTSASSVAVTDSLPSSVTFVSASPGCVNLGGSIACTIGTMGGGANSNITVTVKANFEGPITNTVTVASTTSDPNAGNNAASNVTTVVAAPAITAQPTNQVATAGANVNFYVTATGTAPLSYQWALGGTVLPGATTATLALAGVQAGQAGNYTVLVTNVAGSVTSAVAALTVLVSPSITQQPADQTVLAGTNTTLQVGASGTSPLGYQWLLNGTNLQASSVNSLTLTNVQTSQSGGYCVVVTNVVGSVTSVVANLTIVVSPSISQQPSSLVVTQGQDAVFGITASGDSPLSYQWRFQATNIAGAMGSGYTIVGATSTNAGGYDAIVSNPYGSATSAVAQLTVLVPPSVTSQPTNQTVVLGTGASFQIAASGTAPLGYQWLFNGTNLVGQSTNCLSFTNAQTSQAGAYCVVITNVAGSVTSVMARLTVAVPPSVSQQPVSLVVAQGQDAAFGITASGDAPLSYQWRFNATNIGGATGSGYTLVGATSANAGNYDAVVSNPYGSATSTVAQLTVLVPPSVTSQPTNQTVVAGANASFQVTASGTGPLGYQWMFNGTNLVGQSTNCLSFTNAQTSQSGGYCVVITNVAGSVTSVVASLTVAVPPSISQQPVSLVVTQGQDAAFGITASGDAPLNYQWRFNATNVAGATASGYSIVGATSANAGGYDAIVSNPYGSATSTVAQLTVLVPPSIAIQPTNQTVVAGANASFQVTASGTGPLGYQWMFNGTNMVGQSTNCLSFTNAQTSQSGGYCVVVTNMAGSVTSVVTSLTVGVPPSINEQPVSLVVAQGQDAVFSVVADGDAPLSYQWRFNATNISGATGTGYTIVGATSANVGSYDAIVSNLYGSATSTVARLTVLVSPIISLQSPILPAGGISVFLASQTGVNYTLEYKASLADTNWIALLPIVPGTGDVISLQDTNGAVFPTRFYRVSCE